MSPETKTNGAAELSSPGSSGGRVQQKEIFLVLPSQGSSVIQLINAPSSSTLHILIPPPPQPAHL